MTQNEQLLIDTITIILETVFTILAWELGRYVCNKKRCNNQKDTNNTA